MEYFSAIKKSDTLPFATTWMDLEHTLLSKTKVERKITYNFTYMWNLKIKVNGQANRLTGKENQRVVARGLEVGRIDNQKGLKDINCQL